MTAAQNRRRLAVDRAAGTTLRGTGVARAPRPTSKVIIQRRARCEALMASVAAKEGFTLSELREQDRRPHLVDARRAVMLAARKADFPLEDIGHVLHRHYTSVLNVVRRLEVAG